MVEMVIPSVATDLLGGGRYGARLVISLTFDKAQH